MNIELSDPKSGISEAVRYARKSAKLSQEKLAQKAGLSVRTIRLLESGKGDPRESTINAICTALSIPPIVFRCLNASKEEREKIARLLSIYHAHREE